MDQQNEQVLLTFIKNPELGKVKTRLAKTVGDERALRIYKSLMSHTRTVVQSVAAQRLLFYSEWINEEDEWPSKDFQKALQHTGDLGDRMQAAFEAGFQVGSKVVIVGSDCPGLSPSIINQAFSALEEKEFVIGPALDGGYYLLGMRNFYPSVFQNIEWSTASVKAETLKIIEGLGEKCAVLDPLSDIDFEEDWDKYGWEVK